MTHVAHSERGPCEGNIFCHLQPNPRTFETIVANWQVFTMSVPSPEQPRDIDRERERERERGKQSALAPKSEGLKHYGSRVPGA